MESNKYYKPEIEEFHIGYEYEMKLYLEEAVYDPKNGYVINSPKVKWNRYTCLTINQIDQILNKKYSNNELNKEWIGDCIRVKYLDKEDIEILGWEKKSTKYYIKELPSSYPYHLYAILDFRCGFNDISIDAIRSYENRDHDDDKRIFKGTIKNKSELKKLLKQLNIDNA